MSGSSRYSGGGRYRPSLFSRVDTANSNDDEDNSPYAGPDVGSSYQAGGSLSERERAHIQVMGRRPNDSELDEPELKPLTPAQKNALGRTLRPTRTKAYNDDNVEGVCMAVNSTGNTLVICGPQNFLQVYDTSSMDIMSTIDLEAGKGADGGGKKSYGIKEAAVTTALRYVPDTSQPNPSLLLAAQGSKILQVHVSTGKIISTVDEGSNKISNVKCRSDGKAFVTCGSDSLLRIYNNEDGGKGGPTSTLRNGDGINAAGHNNQVFGLAWHPEDPNVILSAGWDKTVQIWDLRACKAIKSIFGSYVCGDSLDVKGNKILIGSWRHQSPLEVWDLPLGKLVTRLPWSQPVMDGCRPYAAKFGTGAMQGYIVAGGSGKFPVVRLYSESTSELLGSMVAPSAVHSLDMAAKGLPAPMGMNGSPSYAPGTDKMRFVAACCAKELCILEMRYSKSKEEEELPRPASLWPVLITRCIDGRIKDCLPNLKRIDCIQLDTLMDLNGCPSCLEVLDCSDCPLIQSLDPLAACTNLRDLTIGLTSVSSLKPLIGCVMLQRMCIESTSVIDLGPLSSCTDLEVLYAYDTQGAASWPRVLGSRHSVGGLGSPKT